MIETVSRYFKPPGLPEVAISSAADSHAPTYAGILSSALGDRLSEVLGLTPEQRQYALAHLGYAGPRSANLEERLKEQINKGRELGNRHHLSMGTVEPSHVPRRPSRYHLNGYMDIKFDKPDVELYVDQRRDGAVLEASRVAVLYTASVDLVRQRGQKFRFSTWSADRETLEFYKQSGLHVNSSEDVEPVTFRLDSTSSLLVVPCVAVDWVPDDVETALLDDHPWLSESS